MHRRDRIALEHFLAPDFVLRSSPDIARETWIHNAMTLCWGGRSDIDSFNVRQHGDTAIASFEFTGYVDPESCQPAVLRSLVTDVWVRGPSGWRLQVRHSGPPPESDAIAAQYGTAPAPPPVWEIAGELSLVATGGNASTRTLGAGGHATRRSSIGITTLKVGFVTSSAERVTRAQSLTNELRHGVQLRERLQLFARFSQARDRFAGIDNRFTADAGVAYAVALTGHHSLITEASLGFIRESRRDATRLRFASVAGGAKYIWIPRRGTQFSESADLVVNAEAGRDWRGISTMELTVGLTKLLSVKLSNLVEYRNRPVSGFGRLDTRTTAALMVSVARQRR